MQIKKNVPSSVIISIFLSLILLGCDKAQLPVDDSAMDSSQGLTVALGGRSFAVELVPAVPTVKKNIDVRLHGTSEVQKVAWEVNGELVPDIAGRRLPAEYFLRGDQVVVTVLADGQEVSAETTVGNSPPEVVAVVISRPEIHRGIAIETTPEGVDADGDKIGFRFVWTLNGQVLPGEEGPVLSGGSFYKGDIVGLSVVPHDGEIEGQPSRELEFQVVDAPPVFVTSPPEFFNAAELIYQARAVDPDGEEIEYVLAEGPKGMTINEFTGEVRWLIPAEAVGEFKARIVAHSSDGPEVFQDFSLQIQGG